MKKFFALLALVLGLVSCQTEPEGFDVNVGGEQDVNITVSLPEGTRADSALGAFGLGNVDFSQYDVRFQCEVHYNGQVKKLPVQISDNGRTATFPVRLIANRDYKFVVWADLVEQGKKTDLHYITTNGLDQIEINDWKAMDETRDAFTCSETRRFERGESINLELTRPFAKLRVITTDIDELMGIKPTWAKVEYSTPYYTSFNAYDQKPYDLSSSGKTHSELFDIVSYESADSKTKTLFTDYFFAINPENGQAPETVAFTMEVFDENGATIDEVKKFNTSIPVKRNYVTTIKGDILTYADHFTVTIDDAFENADDKIDDAPYYQVAVTNGADLLKAIAEGREIIALNNITVTAADANFKEGTTRATGEPINAVINLNDKTITIENNGTGALVDLEGGVLVVEGNGAIESTAGTLVEGDVVVTGVATVDTNVAVDENGQSTVKTGAKALAYVLKNGGTYVFTEDMTADEIIVVEADDVVLDGNGKTLTSSAVRAINVSGAENVTIKNLNIVASGERAINVIQNSNKVTIENVTATAANYTVNVAGSAPNANVVINNSDLTGLNTVNIGAENTNIVINNTKLTSDDKNEDEGYDAISINRNGTNSHVTVNGGEIVLNGDSVAAAVSCDGSVVTFNGTTGATNDDVVYNKFAVVYGDTAYTFTSFDGAIATAIKDNKEVTVIRSFSTSEAMIVEKGKTVVLNLNGKTITGTDKSTGSFGLITNMGNLTVKNGTMTLKAENNRGWNAYSSVISNNPGGNLVVEDVTIEHLGGTDMAYGIDNLTNGKGTSAIATVNEDAVVKSTYRAIRQFLNGIEATNELTVNAGAVVEGANKSIWMQDPSANANTGKLVVNEGATLNGDVYLTVTEGSTKWPVEVSIAASAVKGEVLTGNVPAGYEVVENNGVWTVVAYEKVANGLFKKDAKTYLVMNADGLVALSERTIKGGEVVELGADIDLTDVEFNGLNAFNSETPNTFDGKGYTVSNWTYTGRADDMGFIRNWVGPIKNLTIKNAILRTGGRSAVIAAKPYGNIENCHVVDCNFQANDWACGLIAGMHNSGNMKNCSATNSYIKSTGGTAAITGVLNETNGVRTYENCSAVGCTINNGGDDPYAGAAIVGLINIDNVTVKFVNCTKSDNTYEGTAKDELYGYNAGDNTTVEIE